MKQMGILFLTLAVAFAFASGAQAQTPNPNAKVALHIQAHVTKGDVCGTIADPSTVGCSNFTVTASGAPASAYDTYIVFAGGDTGLGIAGGEFGINYDTGSGTGLFLTWSNCGDLEFPNPNFPNPNTGNLVTWDSGGNCQNTDVAGEGVQAIAGFMYVYVYSEGVMEILPRPVSGKLAVAACTSAETVLDPGLGGSAAFHSTKTGCNPCTDAPCAHPVPVENTTWGGVKAQFKDGE
jgi:hypothetical protein